MKFHKPAFLFFTLFLLGYTSYIGLKNVFRYNEFKIAYKVQQAAYLEELRLNKNYKQQLLFMQNPDYWELQAKKKLGLINPGEHVVKIIGLSEDSK
ncbi:MAG: hypothetical protein EXS67_02480 [Candidatus Margulisbacteria bacterium]|nr:hypothetical protein [Candidatus Margulisiibacteriota bacterium]